MHPRRTLTPCLPQSALRPPDPSLCACTPVPTISAHERPSAPRAPTPHPTWLCAPLVLPTSHPSQPLELPTPPEIDGPQQKPTEHPLVPDIPPPPAVSGPRPPPRSCFPSTMLDVGSSLPHSPPPGPGVKPCLLAPRGRVRPQSSIFPKTLVLKLILADDACSPPRPPQIPGAHPTPEALALPLPLSSAPPWFLEKPASACTTLPTDLTLPPSLPQTAHRQDCLLPASSSCLSGPRLGPTFR